MTDDAVRIPNSRLSNRTRLVQLEYAFHFVFFLSVLAFGFRRIFLAGWAPDVVERWSTKLDPAWILPSAFGGVDLTDTQLRTFIRGFPMMSIAFGCYIAISRYVRARAPQHLLHCHLALNTAFLLYLHGPTVFFIFCILAANFAWSKLHHRLPYAVYYGLPWFLHLYVLFQNTKYRGYAFSWISPNLAWLDALGTGEMHWYVIFPMSTLRMLGYNYDVWEAQEKGEATKAEQEAKHQHCSDCVEFSTQCYRLRAAIPRPVEEYNLVTYLTYITYIPLYIGGPLTNFNAYISHLHQPQRTFNAAKIIRYAFRTFCNFLALIATLHMLHMCVLKEDPYAFSRMPASEKLLFGLMFLSFLWMKFNVIWKSFRVFGLLDGVEAPEDMNRCFSNTTLVAEFWRDWHASFNQWIVRYMYVPMGGNKSKGLTIIPIFIFIAVWHDIELHLLWWAGIMCVAFIPELIVGAIFAKKFKWVRRKPYYRHVAAIGGTFSTLALIVANLFGFGTAMESMKGVDDLVSTLSVFGFTMFFLFSTNNVALLERSIRSEDELRRRQSLGLPISQLTSPS